MIPGQAAGPWTTAQIHDTVAKIAAQPAYGFGARSSLLGRFFRFLWDRISDLLSVFQGTVDPRLVILVVGVIVAIVAGGRIIAERRLNESGNRRGAGGRGRMDGRTDYWNVARDDAAAGRYADACHAMYVAVIDTLARQGSLAFHRSKTSGDYARDLRRTASPLHADFSSFARQFDRVIFRESTVGPEDYELLRGYAERAARIRAGT